MNAARRVLLASRVQTRTRRTCPEQGICASRCVELGGIEPPSISRCPDPIRPFPLRTYAGSLAGQLPVTVKWRATDRLSEPSAVFLAVSGLSHRHPSLLLPGCDGLAPCDISAHDDSSLT
jgi:hypothetical protein